jgi:hypothetical protein
MNMDKQIDEVSMSGPLGLIVDALMSTDVATTNRLEVSECVELADAVIQKLKEHGYRLD